MALNFDTARHNMVEQQVRTWDVLDSRVLEAMNTVAREDFVPLSHRALAYSDVGLPLAHHEVMLKPVVAGRLLQAIDIQPGEDVLEIGTGSGYVSACMAEMGGNVTTVEQHEELSNRAKHVLQDAGLVVDCVHGRAFDVYSPEHQADVVVLTGGCFTIPEEARNWVKPGGRLFAFVGKAPAMEAKVLTRQNAEQWQTRSVFETVVPYLYGAEPPKTFEF